MLLLHAFKNKSISLLWKGQVLSSIGDEVYRVAFVWMAVGLIGANAGYLASAQSIALLTVSLFGGKWADHWDHFRTLLWVDLLRGFLIFIPVIASFFFPLSLPLLCFTAILIAGLSGFFEPAMQAILPLFSQDKKTLQAANGLMATTQRLARVTGPMIIGALTAIVPKIHFFTLDSLSFFASAVTVYFLVKHPRIKPTVVHVNERLGIRASLLLAFRTVQKSPRIARAMWVKSINGGIWQFTYGLGMALLVKERVADDVKAFGWVMGAYGVGNLAAALVNGNMERKNPERTMYWGHICLGIGFAAVAFAPNLYWLMLASAFSAIGGPMNDTPFNDLIQATYSSHELPRIVRLRTAGETFFGLVTLSLAPVLLNFMSTPILILWCALVMLVLGIYGALKLEPLKQS